MFLSLVPAIFFVNGFWVEQVVILMLNKFRESGGGDNEWRSQQKALSFPNLPVRSGLES